VVVASLGQGLIIALSTAVVGSILAWVVGTEVSYVWDERRRRRESDLAALATFYKLYGDFFATWKLWSSHKRYAATLAPPDHVQWSLLERAEVVEGGFEALLVKLASERSLNEDDKRMLGSFREGYQMLRERIRENRPLDWWASPIHGGHGFEQYRAFKALAEYVGFLLEASPKRRLLRPANPKPDRSKAIATIAEISKRSEFYDQWWELATDHLHLGFPEDVRVEEQRAEDHQVSPKPAVLSQETGAANGYAEICVNIRATDDISFKLLGLVPLVSGAGIVTILVANRTQAWSPITFFVAVFGALVTFALYRWELRNIDTCVWWRGRAEQIEQLAFGFPKRPPKPKLPLFGVEMGKTEAERFLYRTVIGAWLLLPAVAAATHYVSF
jgi:hypothetical protein